MLQPIIKHFISRRKGNNVYQIDPGKCNPVSDNEFKQMKYNICVILFVFGMVCLNLSGQITIIADPASGCDSVEVKFRLWPEQTSATVSSISWTFSNGVTVDNEFEPIVKFDAPGFYSATCIINGSTTIAQNDIVLVYSGPCDSILEVPNVFSPNDDGINDYLKIRTNGLNIFSLSVYTRSGVLVYKVESPNLMWDGRTLSGQELRPGIYYYVVKQTDGAGNLEKTGFIHLIRERGQ